MNSPIVLTIAGSDPSGGAGIQSDLRTFEALGVIGISAITAITVQNSEGVKSVHTVDRDILRSQIDCLLNDITVSAVKIGMLGGMQQVEAVAEALLKHRPPNVILDPVLVSSSGKRLLSLEAIDVLKNLLFPLSLLITPNIPELEALSNTKIISQSTMDSSVRILKRHAGQNILVKGGHLIGDAVDCLYIGNESPIMFTAPRVDTSDTHGTGCLLSSAIAANIAMGESLVDAVRIAKETLTAALQSPMKIGRGSGYPLISRKQ